MREYYDRRAPEYDERYRGIGLFAARGRPFPDGSFDRVFTAHFYGYLQPDGEILLDGDWFVTVRAR